jgi:sugar phosphate isomerase/epimerase
MMTYTMARALKPGRPFDVKALCEFTRELGLDGVDWVTTYGQDPHEIRRITDDHGLRNICYTFFCDLNFPTPAERAAGRDAFMRGIETAIVLGADKVMLPVPGKTEFSRQESFEHVVAGLSEVVDFADEADVTATVEHFPSHLSPFVVSADVNRAVAMIPQLRVTYDNGNVTTGGEGTYEGFVNSASHIVHAHFKDFVVCPEGYPGARRCLDGKYRAPTLLGDGEVDQIGSLRAMKESGYAGHINFEYEGSEYSPRHATIEGVRRMREMIASLG